VTHVERAGHPQGPNAERALPIVDYLNQHAVSQASLVILPRSFSPGHTAFRGQISLKT
jgi:hypothetical protein